MILLYEADFSFLKKKLGCDILRQANRYSQVPWSHTGADVEYSTELQDKL